MTAAILFGSTFVLVFLLSLQSLNVVGGHYTMAFLTSFGIGVSNLLLFKLAPDANGVEILAFVSGGPFGVIAAMKTYELMHRHFPNYVRRGGTAPAAPHDKG